MTIYFTAGGLLGTAWVNTLQLVVMLVGFAVALPFALADVGGLAAFASASLPATFTDLTYSSGPGSGWTLLALTGPAFVISPGLIQKVVRRRSARALRLGVALNGVGLMLFAFLPVLLGMAGRVALPQTTSTRPRAADRAAPNCCRRGSARWRWPRCSRPKSIPATPSSS